MKIKAHGMMVVAMMVMTGGESTVETTWDDVDDIPAPVELEDALIAGSPTRDRSEIGRTVIGGGGCTGTLISDRVMVSARHCLQYTTCKDRECSCESRLSRSAARGRDPGNVDSRARITTSIDRRCRGGCGGC